ncbi:MAG: C-GCAxxG-C-C family protein [Anaerolineales bacterium]|nr:C-GCAxxG-C-C family protein [Anaerolineales bacterium]
MKPQQAKQVAQAYFLRDDNLYGCAETTFIALKQAFSLPNPEDTSIAMVLNGGVAYGGGICGAISGAALAVGMLAGKRIKDHNQAKRTARRIIARYMDEFKDKHHSVNCRDLIKLDIRDQKQHDQFIDSGIWRTVCMSQIEFAMEKLADLYDQNVWNQVVQEVTPPEEQ